MSREAEVGAVTVIAKINSTFKNARKPENWVIPVDRCDHPLSKHHGEGAPSASSCQDATG